MTHKEKNAIIVLLILGFLAMMSLGLYDNHYHYKYKKIVEDNVNKIYVEEQSQHILYDTLGLDSAMLVTKYTKHQWIRKFN